MGTHGVFSHGTERSLITTRRSGVRLVCQKLFNVARGLYIATFLINLLNVAPIYKCFAISRFADTHERGNFNYESKTILVKLEICVPRETEHTLSFLINDVHEYYFPPARKYSFMFARAWEHFSIATM